MVTALLTISRKTRLMDDDDDGTRGDLSPRHIGAV